MCCRSAEVWSVPAKPLFAGSIPARASCGTTTYEAIASGVHALRLTGPLFTCAIGGFSALWAGMTGPRDGDSGEKVGRTSEAMVRLRRNV